MIKCFSYLRCSGLGQVGEDKDGYARQSESVDKMTEKQSYELQASFFESGVSGKKDETHRPSFTDMVSRMLENGVRHVLVESLQRLAREYRIQEQLLIYLASKGIQLISCDTGENITEAMASDPMKKALIQMQGIFNELDRALLVKKLSVARKRKRDKGLKCEGRKPYGFIDGEFQTLELIKTSRASGATLSAIAYKLNSEGAPTRMPGSKWHPSQVGRILSRTESATVI